MKTSAHLIQQLRDRLLDEVQWLDLAVCDGVCFLIVKCFGALHRVPREAGQEVGQEGRACVHASDTIRTP